MKYTLHYYPSYPLDQLDNNKVRNLARILRPNRRNKGMEYVFAEGVALSIEEEGLRNPLTIEWFSLIPKEPPQWTVRTGNNRWLALTHFLMRETAPCLFICPANQKLPPGIAFPKTPAQAVKLFDDQKVWGDSLILRRLVWGVATR
jgi:hypothetical protein